MELHTGAGFLLGFAAGGVFGGLVVFHETRRQGPVTQAWLDGALAEQDLGLAVFFPDRDRSDHHLGILIMDGPAAAADIAQARVIGRNQL